MQNKIKIWGTGGTIACDNVSEGRKPGDLSSLIDLPENSAEFESIMSIEGSQIRIEDWIAIIKHIDLFKYRNTKAFILTAAFAPIGSPGSDAESNLRRALIIAKLYILKSGIYVLIGNKLFSGGTIRKIRTVPKNGEYIVGEEIGQFNDDNVFEFVCSKDNKEKYFNQKYQDNDNVVSTEIITHGSDTIEYTAYVLALLQCDSIHRKRKGNPLHIGESEILDVDELTPVLIYKNAINRLRKRLENNPNQGLIIMGKVHSEEILQLLTDAIEAEDFPMIIQSDNSSYKEDLHLRGIGTVFGHCDILKAQLKFNILLGLNNLSREGIYWWMNNNYVGEILNEDSEIYKQVKLDSIRSIPDNCRLIKAYPGMDHLAIIDAVSELNNKKQPKLILAAFGDGNLPFSRPVNFLGRFKSVLKMEDYDYLNNSSYSIERLVEEIQSRIICENCPKSKRKKVFYEVLFEDSILKAIYQAHKAGIEVYIGTLVKKAFPDMKKYEPGWILEQLLGCKSLEVKFNDIKLL